MDETCRQFVLQLMQPMFCEFKIAAMLDQIESDNRGKVEEWILDAMMSELRLAAGIQPKTNLHD